MGLDRFFRGELSPPIYAFGTKLLSSKGAKVVYLA